MDEILKKFLKEKCIYIKDRNNQQDKFIYGYSNGLVSFQIEGKQYVTYEKEEAISLLQRYDYKNYTPNDNKQSKEEIVLSILKRCEELEKDISLQELIKKIQPTHKEIRQKKQLIKKK